MSICPYCLKDIVLQPGSFHACDNFPESDSSNLIEYFRNDGCDYVTQQFTEWLYEIDLTKMTGVQQVIDEDSIIYIIE